MPDERQGSALLPGTPSAARGWRGALPALIAWLVLCYGVAALGSLNPPGAWFAHLAAPPGDPPGWVFPLVWSVLYTLMAVAAWLVWRHADTRGGRAALGAFVAQLALNACWSPLFFGLHQPLAALLCILAMDVAIAACIAAMWRGHRAAALLMLPYQAWVLYATYLNAGFWWLNRG